MNCDVPEVGEFVRSRLQIDDSIVGDADCQRLCVTRRRHRRRRTVWLASIAWWWNYHSTLIGRSVLVEDVLVDGTVIRVPTDARNQVVE